MTKMKFTKATKERAKLRLALFGPSGSGKTFTALRLAAGMGGSIAVIDTERGSASKYADRFEFDVLELGNGQRSTEGYIQAIKAARGYDILIVDSLTHAWKELLVEVDKMAAKFSGNKWAAWSKGTPKQNALVDAILDFDGHIIATMRSKTAWETTKDSKGKSKPVRIGLEPVQGKGIEYEFDLLGELTADHVLSVIKDRTGKFQDAVVQKPGEEMGEELAAWLNSGEAPKPKPQPKTEKLVVNEETVRAALAQTTARGTQFIELTTEQLQAVVDRVKKPHLVKAAKILLDPAAKPIRDALNSQPADEPASEQPAEEPKTAAKRPYQPAELRVMLHTKARGRGADLPASEKQAPFVARKFAEALADQDDPTTAYHKALNWLFGTTSAKELNLAQAKAILDWLLDPSGSDDTGDTPLHPAASAEALLILQQARKGAGQTAGDDIPY